MLTITSFNHDLKVGDVVSMEVPDRRMWRRVLYWLLRRDPPMVRRELRVLESSETTFCAADATHPKD